MDAILSPDLSPEDSIASRLCELNFESEINTGGIVGKLKAIPSTISISWSTCNLLSIPCAVQPDLHKSVEISSRIGARKVIREW